MCDRTVRGYLDGQLIQERTLPRIDKVLAISGRDDKTGDIILKVVNSAPEPAVINLKISGAKNAAATVTVLTSEDPLAENTFDAPRKVVPRSSEVRGPDLTSSRTFEPYSLTIIRYKTR